MCGINGIFVFKNSSFTISDALLTQMRDTMVHRGPDGGGLWISSDQKIGLGHRRLSIIDLSTYANQPMSNEDGSIQIVFNGEIYNHADIRKELQSKQHTWKTDHSDTEVIIHAFEEWGIDCIHKFRGMFAFALWDARKQELWLVRDRIGIKPLYYSIHDNRIVFASEIKALLKDPQQKRVVNEEAFYHYLSFLTTPAPDTLFEGIHKLPASTWLRITRDGSIEQKRYWDAFDAPVDLSGYSEADIAQRLIDELTTAVALRKVSDVPVGVFLSGGIDSSTNAALFSRGETSKVKAFSIGYKGNYSTYKNEFSYARKVAEHVGADYHEKELSIDDLIEFLPQMVRLQDEPIADPVCVPVYYVSKLAKDNGVTVCQVGEGADELFWGYKFWKIFLQLEKLNDIPCPTMIKKLGMAGLSLMHKEHTLYYEWLRRSTGNRPIFWGGAEAFMETGKKRILSHRLKQKFNGVTSWQAIEPIYQRFLNKAKDPSHLNWMSYVDLNFRLPELLLMRVDKMSMGVSLEARVPFLDHKFVELAMSIPEHIKTRNGVSKYILKKAVRGLIPDEIIDRKKQGFGVPVYEWFYDKLGDKMKKDILDFCDATDYFDKKAVKSLLMAGTQTSNIWYLLNFVLWHKEYIE